MVYNDLLTFFKVPAPKNATNVAEVLDAYMRDRYIYILCDIHMTLTGVGGLITLNTPI